MDDILLTDFPLVYRIEGESTVKYRILKETDTQYIVAPDGVQMMAMKEQFYPKKFDAQYTLLVKRLTSGVPFSNYKRSKFFDEYHKRLKIENPELLI